MNFDSWNVDLETATAVHVCGFRLGVEGDLSNPSGVNPGKFPEGLSAVEQARLLRCGMEAIMKAAQNRSRNVSRAAFADKIAKHKPRRPVLSLKKSS